MSHSQADIDEEQQHFSNVIAAFRHYAQYSLAANNRRRKDMYSIPKGDQDALKELGYHRKLNDVDDAILVNADFLNQIIANPEIFGHEVDTDYDIDAGDSQTGSSAPDVRPHSHTTSPQPSHSHSRAHNHTHSHGENGGHGNRKKRTPSDFEMDKLRSTLKQFVRDWSEEGKEERDICYRPMKEALLEHFAGAPPEERKKLRVLVPGAGLGRLAFDVANLGFSCQGNEFSHYMLLASYFVLNRYIRAQPWLGDFSNLPSRAALLHPVSIPDVLPSSLPAGSNFSLVAGDFEEIYGADTEGEDEPHAGQWDAILTCFFVDTAKNIVNYLRIIHKILAPGGVWINLGPLLWHFENNNTNDTSIELDLEEVKSLARSVGFELSNERIIDTTYTNNPHSMLSYIYRASFWTGKKVGVASESGGP